MPLSHSPASKAANPGLKEQIDRLFNPRSVALIGASNKLGKWGYNTLCLLLSDKARAIYAVNKNEAEVLGQKAYKTILEVPQPVDMAIITVPFKDIPQAMADSIQKGVRAAIIISGGLAETGEEGAQVERQVLDIARRAGIPFVGPNCMGLFDTSSGFNTVIFLPQLKRGHLALISQSGNSGQSIVILGTESGLGFSKYVSSGNEAALHFEDFLEYLAEDQETKVILGYVEGLREGRRFFELAKEITRRKPLVIVKSGRTSEGAGAAKSHTAAMAGSEVVGDAALKQAGVIRVDEIGELIDVAQLLLGQPLPRGRRVGVLTIGGGTAVMAADALVRQGMELAPLSSTTMEKLDSLLSRRWSYRNPVDLGGEAFNYACIAPLAEDENVDAVLAIGPPPTMRRFFDWFSVHAPWIANLEELGKMAEDRDLVELDKVKEMIVRFGKPIVFSTVGLNVIRQGKAYGKMEENYLVPYPTPERAAKALAHLAWYSEYLNSRK